jgi:hypothetical protein
MPARGRTSSWTGVSGIITCAPNPRYLQTDPLPHASTELRQTFHRLMPRASWSRHTLHAQAWCQERALEFEVMSRWILSGITKSAKPIVEKHGVDFVQAARILTREHLLRPARTVGGEDRWKAVGPLQSAEACPENGSGALAIVVFTIRGDVIRIISAGRASSDERQRYESELGGA